MPGDQAGTEAYQVLQRPAYREAQVYAFLIGVGAVQNLVVARLGVECRSAHRHGRHYQPEHNGYASRFTHNFKTTLFIDYC